MRTPRGRSLTLPTAGLAALVTEEWTAQGERIDFAAMAATRLAYTAIDAVAETRSAVAEGFSRWAESDAICYFAEGPGTLVARQEAVWTPLLSWARDELGLPLHPTRGVMHRAQPPQSVERACALAMACDDFALAGLSFAAGLYGSAILALALARGLLSGEAAFEASRIDEAFQNARWGVDAEAAKTAAALSADSRMLQRWFEALSSST